MSLKKLLISTAEVSGDRHGAALAEAILKAYPDCEIHALGGDALERAGAKIIRDDSTKSSIGLLEGLPYALDFARFFKDFPDLVKKEKYQALICVDGQGRNLPLVRLAKKYGLRSFYFFPPPVFIWGAWNSKVLKNCENNYCVFEPNYKHLRQKQVEAQLVDHPFCQMETFNREAERSKLHINSKQKLICIFPGSRPQEIQLLSPVFAETVELLKKTSEKYRFVISLAHGQFEEEVKKYFPSIPIIYNKDKELMAASDFGLLSSGTATLQAAFLALPVAICYKISFLSYWIAKLLVKVDYIGMANILAKKEICREFINKDFKAKKLKDYAVAVLEDEQVSETIKKDLKTVCASLNYKNPTYQSIVKDLSERL